MLLNRNIYTQFYASSVQGSDAPEEPSKTMKMGAAIHTGVVKRVLTSTPGICRDRLFIRLNRAGRIISYRANGSVWFFYPDLSHSDEC